MSDFDPTVVDAAGAVSALSIAKCATVRERILQAITTRLTDLTVANQYSVDAGLNVFRYRRSFDESLPSGINVLDGSDRGTEDIYGNTVMSMTVVIELVFQSGDNESLHSTEANAALGDLIRVMLFQTDLTLGGLAEELVYGSGMIQYPADGRGLTGIRAEFNVKFITPSGNPFSVSS